MLESPWVAGFFISAACYNVDNFDEVYHHVVAVTVSADGKQLLEFDSARNRPRVLCDLGEHQTLRDPAVLEHVYGCSVPHVQPIMATDIKIYALI